MCLLYRKEALQSNKTFSEDETEGVFLVMTKITFVPVERDFSVNTDS